MRTSSPLTISALPCSGTWYRSSTVAAAVVAMGFPSRASGTSAARVRLPGLEELVNGKCPARYGRLGVGDLAAAECLRVIQVVGAVGADNVRAPEIHIPDHHGAGRKVVGSLGRDLFLG